MRKTHLLWRRPQILLRGLCVLWPALLPADDYTLDWDSVSVGGGLSTSADGRFVLVDTVGQPDTAAATSEVYGIEAGFMPGLNSPPLPGADWFQRATNRTAKIRLATLLANDTDPDRDTFTLTSLDALTAEGGTLTLDSGWVCYVPPVGFNGADSFAYVLTDAEGYRATNMVSISMNPPDSGSTLNLIAIVTLANGHRRLELAGIAGRTYTLQWKSNLGDPAWQDWAPPATCLAGTNGLFYYDDTTEPPPPQRFYRAVSY